MGDIVLFQNEQDLFPHNCSLRPIRYIRYLRQAPPVTIIQVLVTKINVNFNTCRL